MKSLASSLDTTDTPQKKQKIESELWSIDSEISKVLRKMIIYGSLISAAGGLGADRAYKEIKKTYKETKTQINDNKLFSKTNQKTFKFVRRGKLRQYGEVKNENRPIVKQAD